MVRGEPEHGFERDVPVEAPIVSEDKLVEIGVDVLAAQPMIGAEPPTLHQREDSMNPGQHGCAPAATGGADKPLWPTPLEQERRATRLVRKARLKLAQRSRPSHPMSPPARR